MSNIHRFVGPSGFKGFLAFVALSLALTVGVARTPTAKPRQEPQPAQEDAALLPRRQSDSSWRSHSRPG